MQILGNLFNIIIFVGFVGSLFTVALIFLQKVLHFTLPLWVGILGVAFYLIPIIVPQVKLVPPEESFWIRGYEIASIVWIIGAVVFLFYYLLRGFLAYRAIKKYCPCTDERISLIYGKCADELNMRRLPKLLFGTLKDPACVVTIFHPAVILNADIAKQLSEKELEVVSYHELTHIIRKHHLFQRIYDLISILYWFNPLLWIAKYEFAYTCEMDCDNQVLKTLSPQGTVKEYTTTMLRLMELSAGAGNASMGKINALGFLMAKQRFINILHKPSRKKEIVILIVVVLCIALTITLSATTSRAFFYPYPAYSNETHEYR